MSSSGLDDELLLLLWLHSQPASTADNFACRESMAVLEIDFGIVNLSLIVYIYSKLAVVLYACTTLTKQSSKSSASSFVFRSLICWRLEEVSWRCMLLVAKYKDNRVCCVCVEEWRVG